MQIYKILTQKYTLKKIKPDFCGHNGNPLENKIIQKQVDLEGKKNNQLFSFFLALSNSKHNTGGRRTSVICGCGLLLPRPPPLPCYGEHTDQTYIQRTSQARHFPKKFLLSSDLFIRGAVLCTGARLAY